MPSAAPRPVTLTVPDPPVDSPARCTPVAFFASA
jgi:hypothetical protein